MSATTKWTRLTDNQGKVTNTICVENASIFSRRFTDAKTSGKGRFSVVVPDDVKPVLEEIGYKVNILNKNGVKAGDEPIYCININVSYKARAPHIVLVAHRQLDLTRETVDTLDNESLDSVDFIITPYSWTYKNESGVSPYLYEMYATKRESYFAEKYRNVKMAGSEDEPIGLESDEMPF